MKFRSEELGHFEFGSLNIIYGIERGDRALLIDEITDKFEAWSYWGVPYGGYARAAFPKVLTDLADSMKCARENNKPYVFENLEDGMPLALLRQVAEEIVNQVCEGSEVYVATNSLFLLRELEIQTTIRGGIPTRWYSLSYDEGTDELVITGGPNSDDMGDLEDLDEQLAQADRYLSLH